MGRYYKVLQCIVRGANVQGIHFKYGEITQKKEQDGHKARLMPLSIKTEHSLDWAIGHSAVKKETNFFFFNNLSPSGLMEACATQVSTYVTRVKLNKLFQRKFMQQPKAMFCPYFKTGKGKRYQRQNVSARNKTLVVQMFPTQCNS